MKGNPYKLEKDPVRRSPIDVKVKPGTTENLICGYDTARLLLQDLSGTPDEVNAFEHLVDVLSPIHVSIETHEVKNITIRYDTKRGNEVVLEAELHAKEE
ncbi:MAG: hypothetical protein IKX51_05130 [Bacteroidales bacterium]|nr:hypothetical protein [Bacteroidales bacterium]